MAGCNVNPREREVALLLAVLKPGAAVYPHAGHGALAGYERASGGWLDIAGGEQRISCAELAARLVVAGRGRFTVAVGGVR